MSSSRESGRVAAAFGIAALSSLDNLSVGFGYALKAERIGVLANGLVALVNSSGMLAMMFAGHSLVRAMPSSLGSPSRIGQILAGILYMSIGLWEAARLYRNRRSSSRGDEVRAGSEGDDEEEDEEAAVSPPPSPSNREEAAENLPVRAMSTGEDDDLMVWVPKWEQEQPKNAPPGVVRNFVLLAWCFGLNLVSSRRIERKEESTRMGFREALLVGLALTGSNVAAGIAAGAAGMDPLVTTLATFLCSFCFMVVGQAVGFAMRKGAAVQCDLSNDQAAVASACIFFVLGVVMISTL